MKNKVLTNILIGLNILNLLLIFMIVLHSNDWIFNKLDSYEIIVSAISMLIFIFEVYCFIFLLDSILGAKLFYKTLVNLVILCSIFGVLLVCFVIPMLIAFYDFIILPLVFLSPMIIIAVVLFIKLFRKRSISRFSIYLYILVPLAYIFICSIYLSYVVSFGGIV